MPQNGIAPTPYQWIGRWGYQRDIQSAGYYVRARTYGPLMARWFSTDPEPSPFHSTDYIYSLNSPVTSVDPSGLKCTVCQVLTYYGGQTFAAMDGRSSDPRRFPHRDFGETFINLYNEENDRRNYPQFHIEFSAVTGTGHWTQLNNETSRYLFGAYGSLLALFFIDFDVCETPDCKLVWEEDSWHSTTVPRNGSWSTTTTRGHKEDDAMRTNFQILRGLRVGGCKTAMVTGDRPVEVSSFVNPVSYLNTLVVQRLAILDTATQEPQAIVETEFRFGFAPPVNVNAPPNKIGYFRLVRSLVTGNFGMCRR
jgi:RHS repeat-associated protein